jgi:hypothetical protein
MAILNLECDQWVIEIESLVPMPIPAAAAFLDSFNSLNAIRPVATLELQLISALPEWTFEVVYMNGARAEALVQREVPPNQQERLVKITAWPQFLRLSEYEALGHIGRAVTLITASYQIVRIEITRK